MTSRRDHVGMTEDLESQDGFSLIEVLVTFCVVALLAGAIYGGLSHLARMRTITHVISAEQELDASLNYLEDLISHSQNLPLMDQRGARASLIGDAKALRLVVQARTASDRFVLREVDLSLHEDAGSKSLSERHSARRSSGAQHEGEFVVIADVATFEISYLANADGNQTKWQERWDGDGRPRAIAIKLEIARNSRTLSGERAIFFTH